VNEIKRDVNKNEQDKEEDEIERVEQDESDELTKEKQKK
jgi:hypothetical protein